MKNNNKSYEMDMTTGPLFKMLLTYSLPVIAMGVLQCLYNAADMVVAGKFAGSQALAAVGSTGSLVNLVVALFIGISLGVNVTVARYFGARDFDAVADTVHTAMLFSVISGVAIGIFGFFMARTFLEWMGSPEDVIDLAAQYLRIYFAGLPALMIYNYGAGILRAVGDTKRPLYYLIISGALNVALNLFFVLVLKMTVNGVATATVLANCFSSLVLLRRLLTTDLPVRITLRDLGIDVHIFKKIMSIGLPSGIQSAVFSISNIVIQSAINSLGTAVIAASSAAFNIEIMAYYVLNSFSQACTTFVGQNYGAGRLDRCRKALILCLVEDLIASACAIGLVLLCGKSLLAIFNNDPEVIAIGYTRLLIIFSAYTFSMLYEVMSGYLRGFGISLVPAVLTTLGVCGVRISWIQFVFPLRRTLSTIMIAYPASLSTTALLIGIALFVYRPSRRYAAKQAKQYAGC